jgi:Cyclin, N-terminal domain
LDKYLLAKANQGIVLSSDNLYLIGMAAVFVASKYEDVIPIFMKQILDDVGHFKFTRTHILFMERDMLETISFKVVNT